MEEEKEQDRSSQNIEPKINVHDDKGPKAVYKNEPVHSTIEKALEKKSVKVEGRSRTVDQITPAQVEDYISAESDRISKADLKKTIKEPGITTGPDTVLKIYSKISQKGVAGKKVKEKNFSKDSFLTWIIVAYTVLILLLGFLVYRDVSKRLNRIEDRVSQIEAIVREKTSMNLEDIKLYDAK